MIYSEVQTALDTQLQTVVGLPTFQAENTVIDRKGKASTPYCRGTLLPAEAAPATLGNTGQNEYFGRYVVDLFYPLDAGKATVNAMVDLVVTKFARTIITTTSGKQVELRAAWCEAGFQDGQYYRVPVITRWRLHA